MKLIEEKRIRIRPTQRERSLAKQSEIKDLSPQGLNLLGSAFPKVSWDWLVMFFIIGLMTLSHISFYSRIIVVYGAAFSALFILTLLYYRLPLQAEVIQYFCWFAWAAMGAVAMHDVDAYLRGLALVLQMAMLILVISGSLALSGNILVVMGSITLAGTVVMAIAVYTGEFRFSAEFGARVRASSIVGNSNAFAYQAQFVIIALLFFWKRRKKIGRLAIGGIIAMAVAAVVASGSRKGFLGVLAFFVLWYLFTQLHKIRRNPLIPIALVLLLAAGLYATVDVVLDNTFLGKRFGERDLDRGYAVRMQMYLDGLQMVSDSPIFGVGLNNYRLLSSTGLYSHSDYIEVASGTGIVGMLLYYSFYLTLWLRLGRLKKRLQNVELHYFVGLSRAALVTILLMATGRPNINSKLTWCFLAALAGYSVYLQRKLDSGQLATAGKIQTDS